MAGLWILAAAVTAAGADDTWVPLGPLPAGPDGPVFALAVDPAGAGHLLAGMAGGSVLRSVDGGATWHTARSGLGRGVAVLAFDARRPGVVLAGTRGAGAWLSADGGQTWAPQPGTEGRTVRAFAFVDGAALAGSDQGVLVSRGGAPWVPAGLGQVQVSALAAGDRLVVAGGDAEQAADALPLYVSADAGLTWSPASGVAGPSGAEAVAGSSMVSALALSATAAQPLLMGTNAGLFASRDLGTTWQQLTGAGVLPAADFTSLAAPPRHPERLYVASDGGASDLGGLWTSSDAGTRFVALAPPEPEVTALAVSGDDVPVLIVATFRPADHAVTLWAYRDAGGAPQYAAETPAPVGAPAARPAAAAAPAWRTLLTEAETPFLAVGAAALLAVLAALFAYARRGRVRS